MPETEPLEDFEVEAIRSSSQFIVFRLAIGVIVQGLPTSLQDDLLTMLETMAKATDKVNGEEAGPSRMEEYSHQTNLAARQLRDEIKKALKRE